MLGVATFRRRLDGGGIFVREQRRATPRAFALVVADDVSKTALSTFIAAFIFSVIALVAIKSGAYGKAGLFSIFAMTIGILG